MLIAMYTRTDNQTTSSATWIHQKPSRHFS